MPTVKDKWERDYDAFMRALEEFPEWMPEDLRNLTLAELRRKWDDPEQRARLLPAVEKLARSAQPVISDTAAEFRAMRAGLAQAFAMVLRVRDWVSRTAAAISRGPEFLRAVPRFAANYCNTWQREISTLHGGAVPALTSQEELRFMLMGLAISLQREEERYQLPLLEWVSLLVGRMDIPLAIVSEQFPDLAKRLRDFKTPEQDQMDLETDVLLLLGDRILPDIASRVKDIPAPEACRLLELRLTERYLATALRHDIIDEIRARQTRDRVEGVSLETLDGVSSDSACMSREEAVAVGEVVDEYLLQSDRPEVDRIIVEGIREETPSGELSARAGIPARTLRDRRQRLLEWCRNRLDGGSHSPL